MTNVHILSDLLLQWLSTRSRSKREFGQDVIKKMLNSNGAGKLGFWRFFYPLLRQGYVEQVRNGRYCVCPPVLRWQENAHRAIWLGARVENAWEIFSSMNGDVRREEGHQDYPQRWMIYADRETCLQTAKRLGLGFSEQSALPLLRRLPTLSIMLRSLPSENPGIRFSERERSVLKNPGVHRLGDAGVPPSHWLVLEKREQPRRLNNNDAIQTARWFMRCKDKHAIARYDRDKKKIYAPVWQDCPMPPLLERLLTLETGGAEPDSELQFSQFSFVSDELAHEILRIFHD